ncbi:hypothetical protein DFJ77DRAFT_132945 [Powellomyces hirtus]|nr:hypothetical protein DFJ77DRAFT_132945 [Powellomyces hirtus]
MTAGRSLRSRRTTRFSLEKCVDVTIWSISDKYSWIPSTFPGTGDVLPWEFNFAGKPALEGIVEALQANSASAPGPAPPHWRSHHPRPPSPPHPKPKTSSDWSQSTPTRDSPRTGPTGPGVLNCHFCHLRCRHVR